MDTINRPNNLKEFVKSKINDNPIFAVNEDKLIDNLVHAISNERIINIIGADGTGKDNLINEVIIPQI